MARILHISLLFGLLVGLTACHNSLSVEILDNNTSTPTIVIQQKTPVENEFLQHNLTESATPTPSLQNDPTPSMTMPAQASSSESKIFSVCSPLEHETVISISEIVSDPYHPPPPGRDERHQGVDFSYYHRGDRETIEGEGIQAIMGGKVAAVVIDRLPYGNMVIIETPASLLSSQFDEYFDIGVNESLYHLYAHMQSSPLVKLGDLVECGQLLGAVGTTGYNIVNPHLHLETRIGPVGVQFKGMAFYTTSATQNEMDTYLRWRTSGEFSHFDPMLLFDWFLTQ
jgi:murein DD-endopeptidase MepM/ murein hydrolase activator NlpD